MLEEEKVERQVPEGGSPVDHVGHPRGTLLVMLVFLMMMIGLWGYVYVLMLERA